MKSFVIVFFIICSIGASAFAQEKNQDGLEDVLYFKNGNVIHGTIIEVVINTSIKLRTRDGDIHVYSPEEIEKITKEPRETDHPEYKQTGMLGLYHFGFSPNTNGIGSIIDFSAIEGYYIEPDVSVAGGLGYESLPDGLGSAVPIFFDWRTYLFKGQITPLLFFDMGYELVLLSGASASGGLYMNGGAGVRVFGNNSVAFWMELGYQYQPMKYSVNYYSSGGAPFITDYQNMTSVSLRAGISF